MVRESGSGAGESGCGAGESGRVLTFDREGRLAVGVAGDAVCLTDVLAGVFVVDGLDDEGAGARHREAAVVLTREHQLL